MRYYELSYLISPDLTEPEAIDLQEKINSFLQEKGGLLDKIERLVKKRLCYEIKKKGQAYLVSINFYLDEKKIKEVEKKIKAEPQILRYLILSKQPPSISKISKKPATRPVRLPEKVELKEIEKKLEEILGET